MICWNCGSPLTNFQGKLPFRSECEACHAALHCCRNCVYYKPGLPNDCAVPDTDYITDRTAINFCEEFKPLGKGPSPKADPNKVVKRLFGDDHSTSPSEDSKKRFNDLFREEDE